VANIRTALAENSEWKWNRKKDPGKRVKRREAKEGEREDDWADDEGASEKIAAPTTRSGREAKSGDSVSAGTRSKGKAKVGESVPTGAGSEKGEKALSQESQNSRRSKDQDAPTVGASVDQDKRPDDKTGEEPTMGGDSDVEGQPLRRRGSHSLEPESGVGREEEREEEDGDEWPEQEDHEFEENLTYYEDSLSVMKGTTSTPLGEDLPVWVTTDSGSMTMLMQARYAKRLKL